MELSEIPKEYLVRPYLEGVVDRVNADGTVTVNPSHRELHDLLDIGREQLRKYFKTGSHVRCINGRHEGEAGLIVKVDGDVATVFSDVSKVGRCRSTVSKPVLKAPMVSALETVI